MTDVISTSVAIYEALQNITLHEAEEGVTESHKTQVIPDSVAPYLNIYLQFVLCGIFGLFGVMNNVVNMIIFFRLGLNDSMSMGLMALSLSDFLVSTFTVLGVTWDLLWEHVLPENHVALRSTNIVFIGWMRDIMFLCSAWCTAFLALERCVCVIFPFKVKDIFTKVRSSIVVVSIYIVVLGSHMRIFVSQWLEWTTVKVETGNGTVFKERLLVRVSDDWIDVMLQADIINGAVLPVPAQAIVLVSVFWMIKGLKSSSSIRNVKAVLDKDDGQSKDESNLSSKERRLIKVVLLIAITLTICNVPRFMAIYSKQIFMYRNVNVDYANLFLLLWLLTGLCNNINASINVFIYLVVNVRYRQMFKQLLFCRKIEET